MASPIQFDPNGGPLGPAGSQGPGGVSGPAAGAETPAKGGQFKEVLLESLEQVNRLQQEATQGVERLVTGQTQDVAEVFSAVQKAGVAFDLLMEIRNKLTDAFNEIRQMQV
jgi:flagellar hook-basal body complex protein FliE